MGKNKSPIYDDYGMTQWYWLVRHRENFKFGKNVEIGSFSVIDALNGVEIKDNVKIGYGVKILSVSSIGDKHGKIIIGEGSSIGANSVIMPGVIVGDGAIVGANSFVNKNIPSNKTYVGTPAREI